MPAVNRISYQLVDINDGDKNEDGSIASLFDPESGETLENLRVPDDADYKNMREAFAEGKEITVTVLSAMGKSKILNEFNTK